MNTFTTSFPSQNTASETSLGWNSMPAYGEVMREMRGLSHLDIHAPLAPEPRANNLLMESFWSCLTRSHLLAVA